MKPLDNAQFVDLFVKYAEEHNACLIKKDYSKRSRLNKKLMNMLAQIDTASDGAEIVSMIISSGSKYATLWIANFAFKNKVCSEAVMKELLKIRKEKSVDSITAWALMKEFK